MPDKVLRDDQVAGGSGRRKIDQSLSKNLGGYKSLQDGSRSEPSVYGKYVEPVLHATEHTARNCFFLFLKFSFIFLQI